MAQVALAWLLSKPVVSCPILGATKAKHPHDAVAVHPKWTSGRYGCAVADYARCVSPSDEQSRLLACLDGIADATDRARPMLDPDAPAEKVLADLSIYASASRVDDVFSLLTSGTGGAVAGAVARASVEQSVLDVWLKSRPILLPARTYSLSRERRRVVDLIDRRRLTVPNVDRWLHPVGLSQLGNIGSGPGLPDVQSDLVKNAGEALESITRLPAVVTDLLAMCSHASYAGAWCTVASPPHALGFTASEPYAALFAQCAGTASASDSAADLHELVERLVQEATRAHGLPGRTDGCATTSLDQRLSPDERPGYDTTIEFIEAPPLLDAMLEQVLAGSDRVLSLLGEAPGPFSGSQANPVNLMSALPYLTALSTAEISLTAIHRNYSPYAAATAARMLLEDGARRAWQFGDPDDATLRLRFVSVADEDAHRRARLREGLVAAGASGASLAGLFEGLRNAEPLAIDRRRTPSHQKAPRPIPVTAQMRSLGAGFAEEGWFELTYSLLSQVVHATPLGVLHAVARPLDGTLTMSHEMTALVADATCMGLVQVLGPYATIMSEFNGIGDVSDWLYELAAATAAVHRAAQPIHFLD